MLLLVFFNIFLVSGSLDRFIQMAPLYFFYNLPPCESKDILQDMLDPDGKQKTTTVISDSNNGCAVALQTYDRCVIQ